MYRHYSVCRMQGMIVLLSARKRLIIYEILQWHDTWHDHHYSVNVIKCR